MDHKQLYDLLHDLRCNHNAMDRDESIYSRAIDMIVHLRGQVNRLQTIASEGWVEGWNDGNGFMALPIGERQLTRLRCWSQSEALKRLQATNKEKVDRACQYCNGLGSIRVDFEHPQWVPCNACEAMPTDSAAAKE